ncbi:hypothetical protein F5Y08DRAFT_321672 [Xylaria arbuscula]|nr:hypothetical protein F5Y08DRAFT_321672 [Xylaria arbuscula]
MHAPCPFGDCTFTCSSESALREHTNSLHAGQHRVLSRSPPFKCHCGKQFARLYTLERHVQSAAKGIVPDYPCPECVAYQGNNGFKRKDHIIQHFRFFHKYDDDQLRGLFPVPFYMGHRTIVQICHFETCEYYRGLEFADMSTEQQKQNRPFNKLSEYTMHMKQEHNWSPYPCQVHGCDKVDGKGYFSTSTLGKHYEQKHPGSNRTPQKLQDSVKSVKGRVECGYCKMQLSPVFMKAHVRDECRGKVSCDLCNKVTESCGLSWHKSVSCRGEVACEYCGELRESRRLRDHHRNECEGEVACQYCAELMKSQHLKVHHGEDCKGMVPCQGCGNEMEVRSMRSMPYPWVSSFLCRNC